MCELAEIPYHEAMLKFRSVTHHNVNGNLLRFGSVDTIRLDEAWKTGLSERDTAYFESKAGRLNPIFLAIKSRHDTHVLIILLGRRPRFPGGNECGEIIEKRVADGFPRETAWPDSQ